MIRVFVFISALLLSTVASYAQRVEDILDIKKNKPVNQVDDKGKRHGDWVIKKDQVRGEPGYTTFGAYIHGAKFGIWYTMDEEGDMLAEENYKNNLLDGEVKYYTKGKLACIGKYLALNTSSPYDSIIVEDPVTGVQKLVRVPTSWGSVRHGMWHYYEPISGRLTRDVEYQIDDIIFTKEYPYSKEDSTFYQKRAKTLPHLKQDHYKPPEEKRHSYTY